MKRMYIVILLVAASAAAFGQGKFSGYMFGDYSYNVSRDPQFGGKLKNDLASPTGGTSFQEFKLRRIYLAYDNDISEQFTARLRVEADQSSNTSDGKIGLAVKDAYLKWKGIFSGSDLIFGIQPTPTYEVSEAAWGYRSLEKTILDLRGVVPSRDFGVALRGKLTDDGMVNYSLLVGNGNSNKPENDKYKRYYGQIHVKPSANLQFTLSADYADRALVTDRYSAATPKEKVDTASFNASLFVGYAEKDKYSVGVEGYLQSTGHAYDDGTALKSKSGMGFSLFGSVNVSPTVAAVARYDFFDPNTDGAAKFDARNYVIAGLSWKVDKNVSIIPNVLYETYNPLTPGAGEPDPSLTARVTLYYVFL